MFTYYAVGEAIITTEPKGLTQPGQIQPRSLNQHTIMKEGFKSKMIARIFTNREHAMIYANSLEVCGNWKAGKQARNAPILTFETTDNITQNANLKDESVSDQLISYYEVNLLIANLRPTRLEFLASALIPAIDLMQQRKNCLIV